ncbi:hypothetical protein C8T65DRAFT_651995 [Cerioporus squamosus]|nr:hypothetical protein C8T65DRAFT_651995 [Cerioporus squamosus]
MPPVRQNTPSPQRLSAEERQYANNLAKMRAEIRERVNNMIAEKTDGRITRMHWSMKTYALGIVYRGRHQLAGWPWYFNVPFGNLSDIPGGQQTLYSILITLNVGILRFEPVDDDFADLAKRNPKAVLPGAPVTRPAPWCWGPLGTDQIGTSTKNACFNSRGEPRRRVKDGPKTPKIVPDLDVEEDTEVESDVAE